ncbi:MAG: DinB family protein [Chitinophagaceae bacterium]
MQRRKYGYILLALLVVTGFAGIVHSGSLTSKERKFAANHLKETKAFLFKSVKGLSDVQLNYKPAADQWSVKECVYHLAISETQLWSVVENALKQPANPEKRSEIKMTDEQLVKMMEDRSFKVKTFEPFEPKNAKWQTVDEALEHFKALRYDHIQYIKKTTEDLRNHVVQMPFGWLDCYQVCLMISALTNRHTQQLNEVKADPNFPAR